MFFNKNNGFLEKCYEVWGKVSNTIKKGFDKEPAYNENYLRSKIKPCKEKIRTNFHGDKIPKEGSQCICYQ